MRARTTIATAVFALGLMLTGCAANSPHESKATQTHANASKPAAATPSDDATNTIEEAAQEVDCTPLITQTPSGRIAGETNEGSCDVSGAITFFYEFDTAEHATAGSSQMEFQGDHWTDGNVIIYTESSDAAGVLDQHFTRVSP
jgi:hypothetical protein